MPLADGWLGRGQLRAIDPDSPSTATLLGSITWSPASLFTGLAYDSRQHRLAVCFRRWNNIARSGELDAPGIVAADLSRDSRSNMG